MTFGVETAGRLHRLLCGTGEALTVLLKLMSFGTIVIISETIRKNGLPKFPICKRYLRVHLLQSKEQENTLQLDIKKKNFKKRDKHK